MKQALVKKGMVFSEDVPSPIVSDGSVLIKVVNSCISAGTEVSGVVASGTPLIKRILDQPDKISKVLNLARSEGIKNVYKQIRGELDAGRPTGYSISGIVIGTGKGVMEFKVGDQVAAAGGGLANHAEYVDVPVNLVVKIPGKLDFKEASTVTLGAIALQGVRRADLRLGEYCVVIGTGILGLISVQCLVISGIRVIAVDPDLKRLELAKSMGAEMVLNPSSDNVVNSVLSHTNGFGADAVIFTAATSSYEPLSQAFQMCRRKGKVILVGVSGMTIDRKDIYPKELDFLISTSYGPGRYDKSYEEKGIDYPYAYVRWTENRNLQEYLRLLASGQLNIKSLINDIYPIEEVTEAFNRLKSSADKPLIILLDYGMPDNDVLEIYKEEHKKIILKTKTTQKKLINVALVGAGSFATGVHLPNLEKLKNKYSLHAVVDKAGHRAKAIADQFGAVYATSDIDDVLKDEEVDLVLIATRHDSHASLLLRSLKAGKHVFVEKPLATSTEDLDNIESFLAENDPDVKPVLMVGFNRRFSSLSREIKNHTDRRINPLFIHYRMNAGYIPGDHWVHENGGRIVGEACHIVDLMTFLINHSLKSVSFEFLDPSTGKMRSSDNKSIILKYSDGSIATIEYFAVGSRQFPKEYMEVHFDEKTIVLDDYKSLRGYGCNVREINSSKGDKGHLQELRELYFSITGQNPDWPIAAERMIETTRATLMITGN